jgi:hypothetical protein
MLTGNAYMKQRVVYYDDEADARRAIDEWIAPHKAAAAGAASAGVAAAGAAAEVTAVAATGASSAQ